MSGSLQFCVPNNELSFFYLFAFHYQRRISPPTSFSLLSPKSIAKKPSSWRSVCAEPPECYPEVPRLGTNTPPSLEGHLSSFSPLLGQGQGPLPSANQIPSVVLVGAGGQHSATVVLELKDHCGVGLATPQTPSSVPLQAPKSVSL
ncbi:hypothetical protein LIER_21518 [Lithospermum erythrorhizon]|uniref:Uncharacterized protein n=1 Tax=Lithospermum erythrorhizon TaxID=34254 RepID=A0AAV3QRR3_LITER